jgi:hypothetical protein
VVDDRPDSSAERFAHGDIAATTTGPAADGSAASLVTIATFTSEGEAEQARGYLQDLGVPAFLADSHIVGMNWVLGNAVGYVKLQVPSDQVESASELLREAQIARTEGGDSQDEEVRFEDDEDFASEPSMLDSFRSVKRPLVWLLVSPALLSVAAVVMATMAWFVSAVLRAAGWQ